MEKLIIRSKTKCDLLKFCTIDLVERVFSCVGIDNISFDRENLCENKWDVTELLQVEHEELLNNLKVIYVFHKLGGKLIFKGEEVPYQVLFRLLNKTEPNAVLLFWAHNEANDVQPIYDIGEIEIPDIMPRFACIQTGDNVFQVEKWIKGNYVLMNEYYPLKELCEKRVQELNQEYEANEQ